MVLQYSDQLKVRIYVFVKQYKQSGSISYLIKTKLYQVPLTLIVYGV